MRYILTNFISKNKRPHLCFKEAFVLQESLEDGRHSGEPRHLVLAEQLGEGQRIECRVNYDTSTSSQCRQKANDDTCNVEERQHVYSYIR